MRFTLKDYFDNKLTKDDNFIFLGDVPEVLKMCGFNKNYKIAITKKVLDKIKNVHNISDNNIINLYENIQNPVFVSKSYGNTFTATINNTDNGKEKDYILVSFVIDKKISNIYINEITSVYDRTYNNKFFNKEEKNIICFNRKKIKDFYLNSNRLQMYVPKEDSVSFTYDDSITNNIENVNSNESKNPRKNPRKKSRKNQENNIKGNVLNNDLSDNMQEIEKLEKMSKEQKEKGEKDEASEVRENWKKEKDEEREIKNNAKEKKNIKEEQKDKKYE